jgi:hypothetical protein
MKARGAASSSGGRHPAAPSKARAAREAGLAGTDTAAVSLNPTVVAKGEPAMARKTSKGASKNVERAMHERKKGTLKSGSGKKVKSKKQAIAIGLSQARKEGKKVPSKPAKKAATKKTTKKKK